MNPSPPSGQTSVPPGDVLQRGGRVRVDGQVLGHVVIEARVDELRVPADVVDPVDVRHDHLPVPPDHTVQEQVPVLLLGAAEGAAYVSRVSDVSICEAASIHIIW